MRRLALGLVLAIVGMTGAVLHGAYLSVRAATDCAGYSPPTAETVREFPLIVVGTVTAVDEAQATLHTETILKGSAQGTTLSLPKPGPVGLCGNAALEANERVLLMLRLENGVPQWPTVDQAYRLVNGMAESANPTAATPLREQDLVELVTGQTNQVVVPAESEDEGQGIEWASTVLPIAGALAVVFVIGLFLMRIWHRIDPS